VTAALDEIVAPVAADVDAALALLRGPVASDDRLRRYVAAAAMLGAEARAGVASAIKRRVEEGVPETDVVDYAILAANVLGGYADSPGGDPC
jgi:hypothetical protein